VCGNEGSFSFHPLVFEKGGGKYWSISFPITWNFLRTPVVKKVRREGQGACTDK